MIIIISAVTFLVGIFCGYYYFHINVKPNVLKDENSRFLKGIEMLKTEIIEINNAIEAQKRKFENEIKGLNIEVDKREQAIEKLKEMVRAERAKVVNRKEELKLARQEYENLMKEYNFLFEKSKN